MQDINVGIIALLANAAVMVVVSLATRGAAAKETPEASAWEGRDREADQQPAGRSEA